VKLSLILPRLGSAVQRLPKSEHVTITIANGKFLHLICLLNERAVHYVGAFCMELCVQSLNVRYPEEGITRSPAFRLVPAEYSRRDSNISS
jgi:hypothetical protein